MLRSGMIIADRYEILQQIGTGGMSDVYKAKCHKLNRFVAIKVLKREFSEDKAFVSKFRAEAQSAAGLTHPNIVNVYDVGDEDGLYYIVMELVEGITLKRYIEKRGRIPYKEAVSIAIQVVKGMEAAHDHKIVHRDIKPQNIIISKEGKVKVTDFGIAKAASSSTINSSAAMGSVHYISPEQARGGYSDERGDIYSFGVTLYEMLTGGVPFDGETTVSVAVRHIQDEIPAPSSITEGIPVSVDKIVLKCTQKKVDMRYQTVSELMADLKKSLVMPEVDFVKIAPAYGNASMASAMDDEEELLDDSLFDDLNEDSDEDYDDDFEEFEDDENSVDIYDRRKKKVTAEDEKIDQIMKWIGIGIAALILIITLFIVFKVIFSTGSSNPNNQNQSVTSDVVNQTTGSSKDNEQVKVPSVVGKTEEEAKLALNAINLGYTATYETSDTVEAGKVINQAIIANTLVDKNTTIALTISTGVNSVEVPNVAGMSQIDASAALEAAGFTVSVKKEHSDTVEEGKVISQVPQGKGQAAPKSTVTITVCEKKKVTVPNVIGMSESDAMQKLEKEGLKGVVASDGRQYHDNVPKGEVITQGTRAGDTVVSGTEIKLVISKGPSPTTATKTPEVETTTAQQAVGN